MKRGKINFKSIKNWNTKKSAESPGKRRMEKKKERKKINMQSYPKINH